MVCYNLKTGLIIVLLLIIKTSIGQILKDTVLDIDGNIYHTVKIDNQVWFVENLKTTHYVDGTEISYVKDSAAWSKTNSGAYCDYYNNEENLEKYGRLYNWYAVNESRKICPEGWHVPTNADWNLLDRNLRNYNIAKEYAGWWFYQFNGQEYLPIDYRDRNGVFLNENTLIKSNYGGWWTSTEFNEQFAWRAYIGFSSYSMVINKYFKNGGYSVLCIKD